MILELIQNLEMYLVTHWLILGMSLEMHLGMSLEMLLGMIPEMSLGMILEMSLRMNLDLILDLVFGTIRLTILVLEVQLENFLVVLHLEISLVLNFEKLQGMNFEEILELLLSLEMSLGTIHLLILVLVIQVIDFLVHQ